MRRNRQKMYNYSLIFNLLLLHHPVFQQWFNMYKPITINTTLLSEEADSFVNKLDPNKVFKSKNKTPVMKKKQPSQPAGVQKSNTNMSSTKTSSLAGNSSRKRDPQI